MSNEYFSVIFVLFPRVIAWTVVSIFDSSNLINSPKTNWLSVKYAISTFSPSTLVTNCATAPLSSPIIFSPTTVFVFKDKPETVVNLSRVGSFSSWDSKIDTMLTTSGTFNDISLSSILNP